MTLSVADALTIVRLLAALVMPAAVLRGSSWAAVLWIVAVATDFFDGRLARRSGRVTARGAVLDPVADVAFIMGALVAAALVGRVSWLVPLAIACSVGAYAHAMWRARREAGPSGARTVVGHAAGIVNYAMVGVMTGAIIAPDLVPSWVPAASGGLTVLVNLAAVGERVFGRGPVSSPARAA